MRKWTTLDLVTAVVLTFGASSLLVYALALALLLSQGVPTH
jgi:hypothetical protein